MTEAVIIKKPVHWIAEQWTGFYMVTVSVMKGLKYHKNRNNHQHNEFGISKCIFNRVNKVTTKWNLVRFYNGFVSKISKIRIAWLWGIILMWINYGPDFLRISNEYEIFCVTVNQSISEHSIFCFWCYCILPIFFTWFIKKKVARISFSTSIWIHENNDWFLIDTEV